MAMQGKAGAGGALELLSLSVGRRSGFAKAPLPHEVVQKPG